MIKFVDMFSGIGGFREGLTRAGGFECVGRCEIDKYANRSYNALFDTKGEWFIEDARKADPSAMPDFQLLCGGFPCQTFSIAGSRKGFGDPRGTLFFELARLAEARKPSYLLFENVPGLLSHDGGRTFATILNTLDRLGYGVEWQCLNSKDFGVPQSRNRVYIVGYLDERCRGKVFPFTETAGSSLIQTHGGHQGERVYSPEGLSCTLAANPGGFGGKTGLYEVGVPITCATKTGYQLAQVGDSIDLSYATVNSRRGRVGKEIAHTLTTGCQQGTVEVRPVKNPIKSDLARNTERTGKPGAPMHTLTTKDRHGVLCEGRINNVGFWDSIPLWAVTLIGGLLITVLSFTMILTVYGRMFSLWMYAAIAPIPLSTFAGEPTSSVGKNFIRSYAGVCLQGVVIALSCIIFSAISSSPPAVDTGASVVTAVWTYVGELAFNLLVLVGAIKGCDRIVKEIMGL